MEGKYLVSTDSWFYAPDGRQYRSAWGSVEIIEDAFLGVKTNRNSTNWFAKIGSEEKHIIVAGCQIHYAVRCDSKPFTNYTVDWEQSGDSPAVATKKQTGIYIAE